MVTSSESNLLQHYFMTFSEVIKKIQCKINESIIPHINDPYYIESLKLFFEEISYSCVALRYYYIANTNTYAVNNDSGLPYPQNYNILRLKHDELLEDTSSHDDIKQVCKNALDSIFCDHSFPSIDTIKKLSKIKLNHTLRENKHFGAQKVSINKIYQNVYSVSWSVIDTIDSQPTVFTVYCQANVELDTMKYQEITSFIQTLKTNQSLQQIMYLIDKHFSYLIPKQAIYFAIKDYYCEDRKVYDTIEDKVLENTNAVMCQYGILRSIGQAPVSQMFDFAKQEMQTYEDPCVGAISSESEQYNIIFGSTDVLQKYYDVQKKMITLITI